jgi:hypothetical protein
MQKETKVQQLRRNRTYNQGMHQCNTVPGMRRRPLSVTPRMQKMERGGRTTGTTQNDHTSSLYRMTDTSNEEQNIAILQCNLHKSQPRTHSILNDPTSLKYTMLTLQEQYWSEYTESSLIHHSWTLIESRSLPSGTPRSAIYINNSKLSTEAFQIIDIPLSDIMAIAINTINS